MSGTLTKVTPRSTMPFLPRSVQVSLISEAGAVLAGSDQRLTVNGWAKSAGRKLKSKTEYEQREVIVTHSPSAVFERRHQLLVRYSSRWRNGPDRLCRH